MNCSFLINQVITNLNVADRCNNHEVHLFYKLFNEEHSMKALVVALYWVFSFFFPFLKRLFVLFSKASTKWARIPPRHSLISINVDVLFMVLYAGACSHS